MKHLLLFTALVVLASAAWAQAVPPPAETDFKSDRCATCKMAVTSKSYAAQIVTGGKPLFFDDIGCLVQYERQGLVPAAEIQARYVRSASGDAWLLVEKAVWVSTKEVRTPMGYGFHAFADKKAAEAFVAARKGASILAWTAVPMQVPGSMGKM